MKKQLTVCSVGGKGKERPTERKGKGGGKPKPK